jgi:hypothetical protein
LAAARTLAIKRMVITRMMKPIKNMANVEPFQGTVNAVNMPRLKENIAVKELFSLIYRQIERNVNRKVTTRE